MGGTTEAKRAWKLRNPDADRLYYERNHAKIREQQVWDRIKYRYGITREEWETRFEAQNGTCAICDQPCSTGHRLVVDHNHETGQVRGLLCKACNFQLGVLEKIEWREAAEAYLAYWIREM